MKWFKHDTDGHRSEMLILIREKFGREWVCRWYEILEMVAEKMDETDRCHLALPISEWCKRLDCTPKKLRSFLVQLVSSSSPAREQGADRPRIAFVETAEALVISIPNLLEKRDNYTKNLQVSSKSLTSKKEKEIQREKEILPSKASDARENLPPEIQNGKSTFDVKTHEPEIYQLAQDLIQAAGITDRQDRKDIAWDCYHAVKRGNEQTVHTLIAELKQGEHDKANNVTAAIRARLKQRT